MMGRAARAQKKRRINIKHHALHYRRNNKSNILYSNDMVADIFMKSLQRVYELKSN